MRQHLFISHANPEDNTFAIWLSSRLTALGYKTWLDRNALLGGEKTWEEIDKVIRHQAAKVLLVYSKNICRDETPGCLKDGIAKEVSLAESISKQDGLQDYLILLNVDNSSYNLFIGADRLNQIPFHNNWAEGLRRLIRKLQKDGVSNKTKVEAQEFARWYESKYITKSGIIPKRELFYTSLWQIPKLPERFFLYQYTSEQAARRVFDSYSSFPVGKIVNVLSSFADLKYLQEKEDSRLFPPEIPKTTEVKTSEVIALDGSSDQKIQGAPLNHLKSYLNRMFYLLAKDRKLSWYEIANKRIAYYHTLNSLPSRKVNYGYASRPQKRKKALYGIFRIKNFWHYAVSIKPVIEPFMAFNMKPHIIFTEDGDRAWPDKEIMHRYRRAKGRRLFNKEWRDMHLAFIQSLKDKNGLINIAVNKSFSITMKEFPFYINSDFGYLDPKGKPEDKYSSDEYDEEV